MSASRATEHEILSWIVANVADVLKVAEHEVDPDTSIDDIALDSLEGVALTGALSDWLGMDVDPALIWEHDTLRAFARDLAERQQPGRPAIT